MRREGLVVSGRSQGHHTLNKQLMEADHLLAKTFGPAGRIGKHGEASPIPPGRPKRLVMLREGHRTPRPDPIQISNPRLSSQVRAKAKPFSESGIQYKKKGQP